MARLKQHVLETIDKVELKRILYCPNIECRKELKQVVVISGDTTMYNYDIEKGKFVYDKDVGECDTVVTCPHCGCNLTYDVILEED